MAHAIEVDAIVEAENRKIPSRKGECRMVSCSGEDLIEEVKKLWKDLMKAKDELKQVLKKVKKQGTGRKSLTKKDNMVVAKRATLSEIEQYEKRTCREMSPGGWESKRFSRREEKFQGGRIVV